MLNNQFVEKLKSSTLAQKFNFALVFEDDEDATIVFTNKNTGNVAGNMRFASPNTVFDVAFVRLPFYEVKRIITIVEEILRKEE